MDDKKAAAIAGVLYYLREEEERQRNACSSLARVLPSAWALYGRQKTMQMRDLVQRRLLKR